MRLTDFCHPNEIACTRTSCVPGSLRGFHRACTPRSLGLRATYQGTGCFTTPENASADCKMDTRCHCLVSVLSKRGSERGSLLPTAPTAIEPLTPLSPLPLSRNRGGTFVLRLALPSFERIAFPREEAAKVVVTIAS